MRQPYVKLIVIHHPPYVKLFLLIVTVRLTNLLSLCYLL